MEELIKAVRTYRFMTNLDQRLYLADEIFRKVEPKLRAFVFGSVTINAAPDVLQEVLKAVALSLRKFEGNSQGEFWSWCYRIARNKLADHFRRRSSDRLLPMSPDEMRQLLEISSQSSVRTPGTSHDLEYAMKLLSSSRPECHALLWAYYVQDRDYGEIADEQGLSYDAVRMQATRCLEHARSLLA